MIRPKQQPPTKPPELIDMFLAGLEAKDATDLNRQIEQNPEVEPEFWWSLISRPAGSA